MRFTYLSNSFAKTFSSRCRRVSAAALTCLVLAGTFTRASVFQWSVTTPEEGRRVYLWIPEDCPHIRGLVLVMKNLNELPLAENPAIREACREAHVGIVYVGEDWRATNFSHAAFSSDWGWSHGLSKQDEDEYQKLEETVKTMGTNPTPEQIQGKEKWLGYRRDLDRRAEEELNRILELLAKESGYGEIRFAPLLVISHSMGGKLCWDMPFWIPQRTWGSIPEKTGTNGKPPLENPDSSMAGVPLLYINQFAPEGPGGRPNPWRPNPLDPGRKSNFLIGQVCDWGGTHFEVTDDMCRLAAMFIRKAAHYRLSDEIPTNGYPKLKELRPEMGWLATSLLETNQFPIAPEPKYQGDKTKASWFFDEEMAKAAVNFEISNRFKKPQFLTVVSAGQELQATFKHFDEINIPFDGGVDDGWTFKLTGAFLDSVVSPKPEERKPAGHSASGDVTVNLVGGDDLVKLDEDTFRYREFHFGPRGHGWVVAAHSGDAEYSRANYQACIFFPKKLTNGQPQQITFPPIADVPVGTKEIQLKATSNVPGQVVEYFVVSGPAEMGGNIPNADGYFPKYTGNVLRLTPIPPGAKFPVKVIVAAYQMGRNKPPLVQGAETVVREFEITKP